MRKPKLGITGNVEAVQANLATVEGVDALYRKINGRPFDALLAKTWLRAGPCVSGAGLRRHSLRH